MTPSEGSLAHENLSEYRNSESEKERVGSLLKMLPSDLSTVLDVGARDGFLSVRLTDYCDRVTALDLDRPQIDHARVDCIKGDVTGLDLSDQSFDLVFCAEVLEHIPVPGLYLACQELSRIAKAYILIGIPYRQDLRVGQTTCKKCGSVNPPWGHVNTFDEHSLIQLFPAFDAIRTSFVGTIKERTNVVSSSLMTIAGNPYGTYAQEEPCVFCGATLGAPARLALWQKVVARAATTLDGLQTRFLAVHPNWMHVLFKKKLTQPAR